MDTLRGMTGMPDLMRAVRAEASRVMKETKGDLVGELDMLLGRLVDAELIRRDEVGPLLELYKVSLQAGQDKGDPTRAYFDARGRYDKLAGQGPSPVALIVAGASLGSFDLELADDGTPTVVVYRVSYGTHLAAIGASVGVLLGGAVGGVLGGQIGGFLGGIIDEKKDDKKK